MKISLEWLKKYLPELNASVKELEDVFPKIGMEVDSIETLGVPELDHVVVGEILKKDRHPDAERLTVCEVSVDKDNEPLQIVCGATNHNEGDRVFVATIGAILPGNFKIKKSKLRGVTSMGMMCSPTEIGLGADTKGLLILEDRPEIGTPINDVYSGGDTVFDLEITANRGDWLSHVGVARELAAYYDLELKLPETKTDVTFESSPSNNSLLKELSIEAKECSLYTASYIKGVKVAPSPAWLADAITAIGLRPVNNIVDITNWVMFELGQPLHAFDAKKIAGGEIKVRHATKGETITTLDEKKRVLDESMMVIADSEKALAIAGVMGSIDGEVEANTIDIVLESAYFNPSSIRQTAHKLILSTDSSYRFIRDVCPKTVPTAAKRAIDLILEVAGGELIAPSTARGSAPRSCVTIEVTPDFIRKKLGFDPTDAEIADVFRRLSFKVDKESMPWKVTVGTFRSEVLRPIDLVEEFIRIHGTDKIPKSPVLATGLHRKGDRLARLNHQAAEYLTGQHFTECYHYSLRKKDEIVALFGEDQANAVELENPLTSEQTHLRQSLIPGLLDALQYNQNHGNVVTRLFETGRIFKAIGEKTFELASIGFVINTEPNDRHWLTREAPDFFTAKNIAMQVAHLAGIDKDKMLFESLEESALWQSGHAASVGNLKNNGYQLHIGTLSLKLTKEWDMSGPIIAGELWILPEKLKTLKDKNRFEAFSAFPGSTKDIALVVDQVTPAEAVRAELMKIAQAHKGEDFGVDAVKVFDVYEGKGLPEGKKSLALSMSFRAKNRTLKDKEVMDAFTKIQESVKAKTEFEVRG